MIDQRSIGSLKTPPLILGGNVFGWTADRGASFAVLDAFYAGGGRMIDTADVYSSFAPGNKGGESETLIGEWMAVRGRRNDVLIATKVGLLPGVGGEKLAPARIAAAIDESLARLQTDRVDLYFAHRDEAERDLSEVADSFDRIVKAGKAREIGASNFSVGRLFDALEVQGERKTARYVSLQNQYNLVDRGDFEGPMQDFCVANDIAMTPYYGLAAGYLTGKYRSDADLKGKVRDNTVKRYMNGNGPRVLTAIDQVVEETGATAAQVALAWLIAQPAIAAPIASATSVKQVEDLLGAMTLSLSGDQLALLDDASEPAEATA